MKLLHRSTRSIKWNVLSGVISIILGLVQFVILTRYLPVEVFGVYAFPLAIVTFGVQLPNFGLGPALLYRCAETECEDYIFASYFTLLMGMSFLFLMLGLLMVALFSEGDTRTVFTVLLFTTLGVQFCQTPQMLLVKRVEHKRLAFLDLISSVLVFITTSILAFSGGALWALLAINIVGTTVKLIGLYVWKPVWVPKIRFDIEEIKYLFHFGKRNFLSNLCLDGLERAPSIWIGTYLGVVSLGYYSRAYALSLYPRRLFAMPINAVVAGAFSELADDRKRLSASFVKISFVMVASSFFVGGLSAILAPELIILFLGEKWMPILTIFWMLLVFSLLDPLKQILSGLITAAMGKPELVFKVRFIQLVILIAGMYGLGTVYGVEGVAIAVNIALVIGLFLLFKILHQYVDYSIKRIITSPCVALLAASLAGFLAQLGISNANESIALVLKGFVFALVYIVIIMVMDRERILSVANLLLKKVTNEV